MNLDEPSWTNISLNRELLEVEWDFARTQWVGRCPACAEQGKDNKCQHFFISADEEYFGRWGCYAHQGEAGEEHRKRIYALVGLKGKRGPCENWASRKALAELEIIESEKAAKKWSDALEKFSGGLPSLGPSANIPEDPKEQFRFWSQLWQPDDIVWIGERYDCVAAFQRHLFRIRTNWEQAWEAVQREGLDHTQGITYKADAKGRARENWDKIRFLIAEHDSPEQNVQFALLRLLQEMGFRLLYVLHTGGKGHHGIFDAKELIDGTPITAVIIQNTTKNLKTWGCDYGVFMRGTTRTPGAVRAYESPEKPGGKRQTLVWINPILEERK